MAQSGVNPRGSSEKVVAAMTQMLEPLPDDWRFYGELEIAPTLAGALEAFGAAGYHGTSVRDIAGRVGLTVPALYYHHGNKEGMLVELLVGSVQHLDRRTRQAVQEAGDDPAACFSNFVECVALYMAHRRGLAFLDAEMRALSPRNRRAYAKVRKQLEDLLRIIVEQGVATGQFRVTHPDDTVRALLGMLQAIPTWYDPAGLLSPTELASRYVQIARQAVGAITEPALG
jgi:AcrR family transcriptional regulator